MKRLFKILLAYRSTTIPTGLTAFTAWLNDIVELTGPIADAESVKWVVSQEVMRLNSTSDRKPKIYFVKVLRKYAANQLAAHTVNVIKQAQAERVAQEQAAQLEAAKQSEATAHQVVAPDGPAENQN